MRILKPSHMGDFGLNPLIFFQKTIKPTENWQNLYQSVKKLQKDFLFSQIH